MWSPVLSSGPPKKSSPMIPIESCYLYTLGSPKPPVEIVYKESLSHSEIRLFRKKKPLLIIITKHVLYTLVESSGNSLTPSSALLLFIPLDTFI